MKQRLSREERALRLAALREEQLRLMQRVARRNLELATRMSELHVESLVRELRRVK